MPRFENTSCSQCGRDFGPGNAGFSHCQDHHGIQPAPEPYADFGGWLHPYANNPARSFAVWLNDRRDKDVSQVFHEIMTHYAELAEQLKLRHERQHAAENELMRVSSDRDEADRQAGALSRQVERLKEEIGKFSDFKRRAKEEWGADQNMSFDVVWLEAMTTQKVARIRTEALRKITQRAKERECVGLDAPTDFARADDRLWKIKAMSRIAREALSSDGSSPTTETPPIGEEGWTYGIQVPNAVVNHLAKVYDPEGNLVLTVERSGDPSVANRVAQICAEALEQA